MLSSSASGFMEQPTITFEEALKKEEEYKQRLKMTRPRPVGSNLHQAPIKEPTSREQRPPLYTTAEPSAQRFPLQSQPQMSQNQRPTHAFQPSPKPNQQQRNWPVKPRLPHQRKLPPYVQISRPAPLMSYWCKLCKIDCTTVQNFKAHIGGKKHEAKKLAILEGRSNARGESSGNSNRRNTNQDGNQNQNEKRASECEVRHEGEASGSSSAREVELSVGSAGPSNGLDGLIDLTTEE